MKDYLLLLPLLLLFACEKSATPQNDPVKVIFDTDMGSDCDDVGALAMLHKYADQGKVEILGVIYSSGAVPYGAGVIDAINRYYDHDGIPIGANYEPAVGDTVDKMQAEKLAKDTAAYGNKIILNTDAIEQTKLIRKLLAEALDNSVVYITVGHTKGLYDLLVSEPDELSELNGAQLAESKIDSWVALGALNANNEKGHYTKDWNFFFNKTAPFTKYLVDHFPRPSYFINGGRNVMTGKSLINTPAGNIVRTAYRDWLWNVEKKTLLDQRPSWDLVAVLFAIERSDKYFNVHDNGYLDFDVEKGCRWVETDSTTLHTYVQQKKGVDEELAGYLNNLIAKPQIAQ